MWRHNFPRFHELYEASDRSHQDNYFVEGFEKLFASFPNDARLSFGPLERALQRLDNDAWAHLRTKALPCVVKKEPSRGWNQLFNHLYEAFGYEWLADNGYRKITFLGRRDNESRQTPDFIGRSQTSSALLEVKTINNSKNAVDRRGKPRPPVLDLAQSLAEGFKAKFAKDIEKAREQLMAFEEPVERRIVLVVIIPDSELWLNTSVYKEIDELAAMLSTSGLEVVVRQMVT